MFYDMTAVACAAGVSVLHPAYSTTHSTKDACIGLHTEALLIAM